VFGGMRPASFPRLWSVKSVNMIAMRAGLIVFAIGLTVIAAALTAAGLATFLKEGREQIPGGVVLCGLAAAAAFGAVSCIRDYSVTDEPRGFEVEPEDQSDEP